MLLQKISPHLGTSMRTKDYLSWKFNLFMKEIKLWIDDLLMKDEEL